MRRLKRQELIAIIRAAMPIVSIVTGKWDDGLPPELREQAHQVQTQMIEALDAEAGRDGERVG